MSPNDRALAKLERLRASLTPSMQRAFDRALKQLRDSQGIAPLVAKIERGDVQGAVAAMFGNGDAFANLRAQLHEVFRQSASTYSRTDIPPTLGGIPLRVAFDIGHPIAAAIMRDMDLALFPALTQAMEDGFRRAIIIGLEAGKNPREVAVFARDFIGLTDYDHGIVGTFDLALRDGRYRDALQRALRDRRYDGTLQRLLKDGGTLSQEQIGTMRDAYARKLLSWRSETWSRTATLQAVRQSNLASWGTAFDAAGIPPERMAKTWITTLDGRERPEHHDAHGTTVLFEEDFPVDGGVQVPGDGVYNCRCTFVVRVLARNEEQRSVFLNAPERQPLGDRERRASSIMGGL